MNKFKFIHTADLHLDSPFKGIKTLAPEHAAEILDSTFRAFTRVVDYCLDLAVDFLLISGDIFDSENRSVRAEIFFLREMKRLAAADIKVYLIYGNHDYVQAGKNSITWPDNVYSFSADQLERVEFTRAGVPIAAIYGRSYPERSFATNIVPDFQAALSGSLFSIGVHHTNVDGNQDYALYSPASLAELKATGIDYWALGHIHKGGILNDKDPMIVYAGNTQGRHINEQGMKACHLVEVADKRIVASFWLPVSQISWEELLIDVTDVTKIDELIGVVDSGLEDLQARYRQALIVRIRLTGRSELYLSLHRQDQLTEIDESLNLHYNHQQPWLLVESVKADLKPPLELDSLAESESFLADYLREYDLDLAKLQAGARDQLVFAQDLMNNRLFKKHFRTFTEEDWLEIAELAKGYAIDSLYQEDEE